MGSIETDNRLWRNPSGNFHLKKNLEVVLIVGTGKANPLKTFQKVIIP